MKTTTVLSRFFSIALLAGLFGAAQAQTVASDPQPPAVPANASGNDVTPQSDPMQNAAPMPATTQADPNSPAVRDGMDNTSAGASGTQGNSGASSGTLNKTDQRILGDLAQANMDEVAAAQVAQQKSQNDQVKNFAQQMITDHGQALKDVQTLAQNKGVTLPSGPDSKQQKMDDKLNGLTGAAFDKAYLKRAGVDAHKKVHNMLARDQSRATDPDLKALIAKMQPTVDQHLATVQQLANSSAGGSGTRGVSAAGNPNAATSGNTDSPLDPNNPATHPRNKAKSTTGNTTSDQQ
jgi:putative membrane protein